MKAVYRGDTKEIERLLRQVAEYSMSYHDTHVPKSTDDGSDDIHNEGFYHGWMLSLTGLFLDTHYITSNRETGDGRADLLLEPKKAVYPGVVFEFKVLGKNELKNTRDEIKGDILEQKLESEAQKGYDQIQKKHYEAEQRVEKTLVRKRGVETIYKFGVAFYKKKLAGAETN